MDDEGFLEAETESDTGGFVSPEQEADASR